MVEAPIRTLVFCCFLCTEWNAVSALETTTALIRFLDASGATRSGAYVGGNRARLLVSSQQTADKVWELLDEEVTISRLLSPVEDPPYVLGIGLNYLDHINASGYDAPNTPSVFFKGSRSHIGPGEFVVIPAISELPDYEGELAFVFAKDCKDVSKDDALDCVAGYTACDDVSARCYQSTDGLNGTCPGNGGQFSFSKSFDTHAPLGPSLVSTAALGDASNLSLQTFVNGDVRQNTTTSQLIFGVKDIVAFITSGTTIPKNTVVCTGTPDGVGDTMDPPVYLQDGDVVDVAIQHIGTLRNPISRPNAKHGLGRTHVDLPLDSLLPRAAASSTRPSAAT